MKIDLLNGEQIIDTWTVMYSPPSGGKYNGKLTVTNKRLIYDAQLDISWKAISEENMTLSQGNAKFLAIPKELIKSVEADKSFFAKKTVVTLKSGEKHVFNYGMLNIDPVVAAIGENIK